MIVLLRSSGCLHCTATEHADAMITATEHSCLLIGLGAAVQIPITMNGCCLAPLSYSCCYSDHYSYYSYWVIQKWLEYTYGPTGCLLLCDMCIMFNRSVKRISSCLACLTCLLPCLTCLSCPSWKQKIFSDSTYLELSFLHRYHRRNKVIYTYVCTHIFDLHLHP